MSDRSSRRRAAGLALAACVAVTLAAAGAPANAAEPLQVHATKLEHRRAADAVALLRPLLSPRGTVEEQPGGNVVVVRDTAAVLARIAPLLADFDRPPAPLRFEIQLVRATPGPTARGAAPGGALSPEVLERLRGLLRYDHYEVLASGGVSAREGETVTYELRDGGYSVRFRPGAVQGGANLRLEGFQIVKTPPQSANKGRRLPPRELFQATLNLRLERPMTLVLAEGPDGEATSQEGLMVAIVCRREGETP